MPGRPRRSRRQVVSSAHGEPVEPSTDLPEAATDLPKAATDLPEAATDLPEAATDLPEAATDLPEAVTDLPEAVTDLPEAATDLPEAAFDKLRMSLMCTQFHRNPSLRAQRGNLVGARNANTGTRSPRRFAPRDDKVGTREQDER